ncbi:MAG: adenylate/guanylate cyclase domain-containing protein, partial [Betaproteobacteria bacterium]|nr:adenylate/guanylate cyclase domain-containing protein [Betaproteobacteria bacterium]
MEIVEAVARLEPMPGIGIRVRVGVATGMVVIGDVLGEGAAREQAVSGITAHLAARVQAVAQPGQVLVADSTRLLLGNLFDCQDLGLHPMKGFSEPQRVWHVAAEQHVVSRFKAQRQRHGSAPLVGRDGEAAALQDLWAKAT